MLTLKKITKVYTTANERVEALKGISISFRENEFVSILGQSGCGKTTLLNIIGGLDQYTTGDLIINHVSTKNYKDRDWDTYRNHSVGFIFQSYNLIPHQTILSNVELALTLSGVGKEERRKRAIAVLKKVGLGNQLHKKPNQLSGGQMQRVAIARALVNDPDILLADEPTGALDSKTSVQIIDLLKEIAQDKLVIMVTHNPDLAKEYSTRIVKLLDGNIVDDSNPYEEPKKEKPKKKTSKGKKTFMSFRAALSLSFNNLLTKKGRTLLTAFAGSIGIIGIALILSLSNGVQNYIKHIEQGTLSSYPISIEEESVDMSVLMEAMMGMQKENKNNKDEDKIYPSALMNDLLETLSSKMTSNNLEEFKKYIEETKKLDPYVNVISYDYNLPIQVYNENGVGGLVKVNPSEIMNELGFSNMDDMKNSAFASSSPVLESSDIFSEMFDNEQVMKEEYDLLAGRYPESYNEVILVVDENKQISDYVLYNLGLLDMQTLVDNYQALLKGEEVKTEKLSPYSYDELLNMNFKVVLNSDFYQKQYDLWQDMSENEEYIEQMVKERGETLKIVGIIKQNENSVTTSSMGGVLYAKELKEHIINAVNESEIVKEQKANPEINILTGKAFGEETTGFDELSYEQRQYLMSLSDEERVALLEQYQENSNATLESNLLKMGSVDLNQPSKIQIYPKDFDSKEEISNIIDEYNEKQEKDGLEENVISYSDVVGTMMSSVTSIVDIVSYVLMAFVSVSLIVSSIMIGIITYISVLERTKEIGILRSIGASKKDISRVFNAETFIIGLTSGILGILITVLLNIPISLFLYDLLGVSNLATLPPVAGFILILISMSLTLIAGLIPSRFAAKKDPVEALRTE